MTPERIAEIEADLADPGKASLRFSTLQMAWPELVAALKAAEGGTWKLETDKAWAEQVLAAETERDSALAELAEVMEYAGHKEDCAVQFNKGAPPSNCDCGWTEMRERWKEGKK